MLVGNRVRGEMPPFSGRWFVILSGVFGVNHSFTGGARDIPAQMLSRTDRGVLVQLVQTAASQTRCVLAAMTPESGGESVNRRQGQLGR